MSKPVLQVKKLTKVYPDGLTAVKNLSFELKKGEILGLLGPNGAGKSTTIQMLLNLTYPTSGSITYFGQDLNQYREKILGKINFASTYTQLQGKMTIRQNLLIYGKLYHVSNLDQKIIELAKLLEIDTLLDKTFWQLSSGQQTRAILAKSLINDPKLILMDEPTASLDPDIVNKIIDLIRDLQQKKRVSILFTSHNMDEVSRLCDRVMILKKGQLVAVDTPLNLSKNIGDATLILTCDGDQKNVKQYLKEKSLSFRYIRKQIVSIKVKEEQIAKVLFGLKKRDIWVTNIDIKKPTLEDVFLSYAKH